MANTLAVATCSDSGREALYADGVLVQEDDTIYACDIAEYAKDGPVDFLHIVVVLPKGCDGYPESLDDCKAWVEA